MKKRRPSFSSSRKMNSRKMKSIRLLFIGVLIIVVLAGLYIIFSESDLLLGPKSSLDYDNSKSVVMALGTKGIEWYCGEISSFTDFAGNSYDANALKGLKNVLGNERRLRRDFCRQGVSVCTGTILGDVNGDGKLDITDPIKIRDYVNRGDKLNCLELADFTKDSRVNIQDSQELAKFLFGTSDLDTILNGGSSPSPSPTATASASASPSVTASVSPNASPTATASSPSPSPSVTTGSLKISSNPGGATLKIGGTTKGTTPSSSTASLTLSLDQGSYSGQLIKSGYTTYFFSFSINAEQATTLSLTLTPISTPSPTPSPSPTATLVLVN